MAKKFSLGNIGVNKEEKSLADKARILEAKGDFDFRQLLFEDVQPNEKNFYSLTNIEELAKSIKEFGLLHNITVLEKIEDDGRTYKIISGERRYRAIQYLRENGEEFETIPCKVVRNINEIEEELMLLKGNSDTRELTQEEKRKQVEKLNELYNQRAKANGEKINKKDIKEAVASDVGISAKQVERYNIINEKLIPQLQDYFDNSKITFEEAIRFSRLDEQMQLAILDLLQHKDKITSEEIEVIKTENKKLYEANKEKEKELSDKEKVIDELKEEKKAIENDKEQISNEMETIQEERKKLETRIREEMAQLTEEELNKQKEALAEAEKRAKDLELKQVELNNQLANREKELEALTKKDVNTEEENKDILITKEILEKEVSKVKYTEIKKNIITNINDLTKLVKKVEGLDLEGDIKEIESAINSFKKKIGK